jgi:hypothetical protein
MIIKYVQSASNRHIPYKMCTHLHRLNVQILSISSLISDIWIKSITSRAHKTNTCNYLDICTRRWWRNSLLHFTGSCTRWQHQLKAADIVRKCLTGIPPSSPKLVCTRALLEVTLVNKSDTILQQREEVKRSAVNKYAMLLFSFHSR